MKALLHDNEELGQLLDNVESGVKNGTIPASVAVSQVMTQLLSNLRK